MPVTVPSNVVQYIQQAANGTGIGYDTVACQVNEESGFNPNAVSPTGAEGPYQFEPGTFASYGHGSPFDWHDSTLAYINFMNALAQQFNNDIFNMLAAYNAGPANIQAGYGYAQTILACSGGGAQTGGEEPQPNPAQGPSPSGVASTDDWSQKVRNCAGQLGNTGVQTSWASRAIDRI